MRVPYLSVCVSVCVCERESRGLTGGVSTEEETSHWPESARCFSPAPLALPGLSPACWQPSWTKADGWHLPRARPWRAAWRSSTPALLPASRASNPAGGKQPEVACRRSQTWGCRRVWGTSSLPVEEEPLHSLVTWPARYPTSFLLPVLSPVGIEAGAQSASGVCVCMYVCVCVCACMCVCVCVMCTQLLAT